MRAPGTLIDVRNLQIVYGDTVVLERLNFTVEKGKVFVILGGSGCGKSSLLKHMIGLFKPRKGSVLIDGDDIVSSGDEKRQTILRKIGVMYQSGALFGSMNLLENVSLPLEEFTELESSAVRLIARMKLRLVGLDQFGEYLPSEISGGMQKRAAIARAMALDPLILFLDEPSAGLDPKMSAELDALIRNLSRNLGITFVVVTHELNSIFAIANRAIMLGKKEKGIIAFGHPRVMRDESDHPVVRSFFHSSKR